MERDLPTPSDIMEQLADKVAAQIDRLAPVAFDGALRELTRYHRFLLALNAAMTPDGAPFSYAAIAGDAWNPPHREWLRQYRRLFERAADRLPDDDHFIRSLAYSPAKLLPDPGDPRLPADIVKAILDLGPIMVDRLEAWVTKRRGVETRQGQASEPRLSLAGSDSRAYVNTLPEVIGAWERLLQLSSSIYGWRRADGQGDLALWSAFRAGWPFLWQHLTNTAYCLAAAVWNEDEDGAEQFREALVRWPQTLGHESGNYANLQHRRLLFPSVLSLDWAEASEQAARLAYEYMPAASPVQLFAEVVRSAHRDAVLLTAALLLSWTMGDKQGSDLGGRTARSLLLGRGGNEYLRETVDERLRFRSLFLDMIRLALAGARFREGTYGVDLDRFVETLDNMTERRVVPGRVYTPSTLHGRDGLLLPMVAILAAAAPDEGDDGLSDRIAALARDGGILPEGDRSLREALQELGSLRSALDQPEPRIARGVALLSPSSSADRAVRHTLGIVESSVGLIEAARSTRLKALPIDGAKLERIRSTIEASLLNAPAEIPFFMDAQFGRLPPGTLGEPRDMLFNSISKAQLVEPPMEAPSSGFQEHLVSGTREMAARFAICDFLRKPRIEAALTASIGTEDFWQELAPLAARVGSYPTLLVSNDGDIRALRRLTHAPLRDQPNPATDHRPREGRMRHNYIGRFGSIDAFGVKITPAATLLFSARLMLGLRYAAMNQPGTYVEISFEPDEGVTGRLRIHVHQLIDWADSPIFELTGPIAEGGG